MSSKYQRPCSNHRQYKHNNATSRHDGTQSTGSTTGERGARRDVIGVAFPTRWPSAPRGMTWKQRLVTLGTITILGLFWVACAQATIGAWFYLRQSSITIDHVSCQFIRWRRTHPDAPEQALVSLNVNADLRPIWNWTVKNIFVWVVGEHVARSDRVVLWNTVIRARNETRWLLANHVARLPMQSVGHGGSIEEDGWKVRVEYMVMPHLGVYWSGAVSGEAEVIDLPVSKTTHFRENNATSF